MMWLIISEVCTGSNEAFGARVIAIALGAYGFALAISSPASEAKTGGRKE